MVLRIFILSALLWLLACTPAPSAPVTATTPLVIPTQPATAVANHTPLPILLPNAANDWLHYRDGLAGFGLALPQQWRISPPNPHADQPSLTVANYDSARTDESCLWPTSLAQLTFTSWQTAPEQATLDWLSSTLDDVQSLEAAINGRYAGYLLNNQELILRLTPTQILQIQVTPATAWQLPDVQAILHSLAAPATLIEMPATHPAAPVATPTFCQDSASLHSGPGTHFEQIGLLSAGDTLPVIGRSHDGRWLQLLYPNAPNHTAWASLNQTISTNGQPPIQPIQIQPGNG